MDSRGNFYDDEMMARLDGKEREKLTPISHRDVSALRKMNRKQRRAWLAKHRREQRAAQKHAKP